MNMGDPSPAGASIERDMHAYVHVTVRPSHAAAGPPTGEYRALVWRLATATTSVPVGPHSSQRTQIVARSILALPLYPRVLSSSRLVSPQAQPALSIGGTYGVCQAKCQPQPPPRRARRWRRRWRRPPPPCAARWRSTCTTRCGWRPGGCAPRCGRRASRARAPPSPTATAQT
jgi:hypothetical protein